MSTISNMGISFQLRTGFELPRRIVVGHQTGDSLSQDYLVAGWPSPCHRPSLIPIGLGPVILEHLGAPGAVSHVRPVILVEAGGAFEQFLVDVHDESLFNLVDGESTPGNGK